MNNLTDCRILVTATSYGKNDLRLKKQLEELVGEVIYNPTGKPLSSTELGLMLPGIDGYIAGLDVIDRSALSNADRLKVIARYGVGVDNVDLDYAHEKNIIVTNTPGANSASVAELTIALILALARQLPEAVAATRQGQFPRLSGITLVGKTIGLLGLGVIGRQVANRLSGYDCRILACDPYINAGIAGQYSFALVTLENLLEESDFLSLHLPLVNETRGMFDHDLLMKMKRGAYLINTSRGEIIDEIALAKVIATGHLSGAALDVFSKEPPNPNHPLLALPQVIATPHLGAQTDGAVNAMGWMSLHECLAVLRGETPKYRVA
jgi:D-3-phosphoglycerate dehydrogenase